MITLSEREGRRDLRPTKETWRKRTIIKVEARQREVSADENMLTSRQNKSFAGFGSEKRCYGQTDKKTGEETHVQTGEGTDKWADGQVDG